MTEREAEKRRGGVSRRSFLLGVLGAIPIVAAGGFLLRLLYPELGKRPAEFHVYNLLVEPQEVGVGGSVSVSFVVGNFGDMPGNYTVVLEVDGKEVKKWDISLKGRDATILSYTLKAEAEGVHTVAVNKILQGKFTAKVVVSVPPEVLEKFRSMLPEAKEFKPVTSNGQILFFEAYDEKGMLIAYTFYEQVYGPTDRMEVYGVVSLDYKVLRVDIEPMAGSHLINPLIASEDFEKQFENTTVDDLRLSIEGGKIQAVSGATISSAAVVDAIRKTLESIKATKRV